MSQAGEAAGMASDTASSVPDAGANAQQEVRTYYGQPVVKEPAWTWQIPWYLFAGGLAGGSSGLALGARLTGNRVLADRASQLAAVGAVASPALLIADLGRPARFLHMLRVFKPTSAMSMGSWLLAAYGPPATAVGVLTTLGVAPRLQGLARTVAGVLGMGMGTYTAVLVSDSSIPVWHEARRQLPFVFAAGAAASAGAAATLVTPHAHAGPARRLAMAGAAAELSAATAMERRLGELGEPYHQGDAGRWQKAAKACTSAGVALMTLGRLGGGLTGAKRRRRGPQTLTGGAKRRRRGPQTPRAPTLAGAALVLAGSLCQRWAVYRAGFQSAWDPKHTVKPQRERLDQRDGGP